MKNYEDDIAHYKSLIDAKETLCNELKQKYDDQTNHIQTIVSSASFSFVLFD